MRILLFVGLDTCSIKLNMKHRPARLNPRQGGKDFVATVAGLVDASGYLAGIASGYVFGRILDHGGYTLGFHCLGVFTLVGAVLCLGLNRPQYNSVAPVPTP